MLIVKIGRMVIMLFKGGFFTEIPRLLTKNEILMLSFCSPCLDESIGVLLVKIGQTVEKLFKVVFFCKFPIAP
jgi:hypothetical protein